MSVFVDSVTQVVLNLAEGEVLAYGEVAEDAGFPGAARAVGNLLKGCGDDLPWWRVLGAGGRIVSANKERQAALLREEGWQIKDYRLVGQNWANPANPDQTEVKTQGR